MGSWWDRLVARSDVRQAKRAAWICGVFIIVLLYALGGLSLYVRKTMLTAQATPTPTVVEIIIPTHTAEPSIVPPTSLPEPTSTETPTLFPTLTPNPAP